MENGDQVYDARSGSIYQRILSQTSGGADAAAKDCKRMSRQERDLYKKALAQQGPLMKRSTRLLVGYQTRHFKVISAGSLLVYYDKVGDAHDTGPRTQRPDGVFQISRLQGIKATGGGEFEFTYGPRKFELKARSKLEADSWVTALSLLARLKAGEPTSAGAAPPGLLRRSNCRSLEKRGSSKGLPRTGTYQRDGTHHFQDDEDELEEFADEQAAPETKKPVA